MDGTTITPANGRRDTRTGTHEQTLHLRHLLHPELRRVVPWRLFGFAWAFFLSSVGAIVGVYVGWKIAQRFQ